ncbi:hypothetical protein KKH82_01150 [Patescibacteria group bacterium]|nr:hypothetical protein [Patescibacteria group bacterium]
MEITAKNIEKTKAFFEEATVVFATLETRINEFNAVAKNIENIESQLKKIDEKINLKEIQRKIEKSTKNLCDADLLVEQYAQEVQNFKVKQLNWLIALSVGLITGFITAIVTIDFIRI